MRQCSVVRLVVIGIALVCSGCDQLWNLDRVGAPARSWGVPEMVAGNPTAGGDDPTLSADQLELYFELNNNIARSTRLSVDDSWSAPEVVVELSDPANSDTTPELSHDGLTMLLASTRPGGLGLHDVWMSTRPSLTSAWATPLHVADVSSPDIETDATIVLDGRLLFVSRDPANDDPDIYQSTREDALMPWSTPMRVPGINSIGADGAGWLMEDGLTLYMSSSRSGNSDLFEATRESETDAFSTPQAIVTVTTEMDEHDIWVSADGATMYFIRVVDGVNVLWMTRR